MVAKTSFRRKVYNSLELRYTRKTGITFMVNIGLFVLILLNSLAIVLSTVHSFSKTYHQLFIDFEIFSVTVFSIEYILRIWSCVERHPHQNSLKERIRFFWSAWSLVDLLSIAPFFVTMFSADFGLIRILRLLRIVRLFRMSRYFHAFRVIKSVLLSKREELILSFSIILFFMIICSSLMYYIEHDAQPKVFSSIPAALWWGVNTMTTVGYGDIYPITNLGRVLGSFVAICGISLFALPAGIIASGFNEHIKFFKRPNDENK